MPLEPLDIRIVQFAYLRTRSYNATSQSYTYTDHRYQNYFINTVKTYAGANFEFAPFRAEGTVLSMTGDNPVLQVLFPNVDFSVQLLHNGDGNRLSQLELTTVWLDADSNYTSVANTEYYVGLGASISETTIELRFRSAIDSAANNFPARTITTTNAGPLPLDAQLTLQ